MILISVAFHFTLNNAVCALCRQKFIFWKTKDAQDNFYKLTGIHTHPRKTGTRGAIRILLRVGWKWKFLWRHF